MFKPRVHPHEDAAPDWTHQKPLPKVPYKHGYRLFFCCSGQLGPERQDEAEKGGGFNKDANSNQRKETEVHRPDRGLTVHTRIINAESNIPVTPGEERENKPFIRVLHCVLDD